ncbi:translation initiation factor IF-2-like [Falco cherrug]|uniref:translation initiation factor IF-2-like n=1 Tax=Falco cherrug TaxID=345164 RepID=UPI00247B1EAA|nr:translation initiation factor IF-2-like [Falco cherrug]
MALDGAPLLLPGLLKPIRLLRHCRANASALAARWEMCACTRTQRALLRLQPLPALPGPPPCPARGPRGDPFLGEGFGPGVPLRPPPRCSLISESKYGSSAATSWNRPCCRMGQGPAAPCDAPAHGWGPGWVVLAGPFQRPRPRPAAARPARGPGCANAPRSVPQPDPAPAPRGLLAAPLCSPPVPARGQGWHEAARSVAKPGRPSRGAGTPVPGGTGGANTRVRGDARAPVRGAGGRVPPCPAASPAAPRGAGPTQCRVPAPPSAARDGRSRRWPQPPAGKVRGERRAAAGAATERSTAMRLCSITILLGAALLLPASGGTQALSDTGQKDLAMEQDLAKEIIPGIQAVELLEEGEISEEVEPRIKVISRSVWARQGQAAPEEDRDHLYHPQDNAMEADVRVPPWMLSLEVQSGPEEDRDYIHHS